ncbi:MAG: alpha/beta hydrolase [Halobacteriota archaeon]
MKKETSQVAGELIERLDSHLDDERIGNPFFPERGVQPFPLTPSGFKIIQRLDSDKKTAFVDGGNQEILGAPNFSVQLNRVYFGVWNGNTRIPERSIPKRVEFFAATFSDFTEDLKNMTIPTLVVHGDDDQIVPIQAAALRTVEIAPQATLKVYPGAPHGLPTVCQDQLNADLLAFIRA